MNTKIQKTLVAAAITALIALPASAAEDASKYETEAPQSETGQAADVLPRTGNEPEQASPAMEADPAAPDMAAPGTSATDNPLYARTPEELRRVEVIDRTGEKVGQIKTIVLGPERNTAHAVVSSGGVLGLGAREVVVSLDELHPAEGDRLQVNTSEEELRAREDYVPEQFVELEADRPISEFSAFEPIEDEIEPAREEPAMPRQPQ